LIPLLLIALAFSPPAMQMRRVWPEATDNSGNPSADGHLLSFVDWETGDVAVRDLVTGQNRRLTRKGSWTQSPEYAEWPKVSPDGKRVVYSWVTLEYGHEIRVVDTDGKAPPRVVLRNPELHYIIPWAWSPDGKSIIALLSRGDDTNQLTWVSIANGATRPLKSLDWRWPMNVSLSSDGRFLVYDLNQGENATERDLFVLTADGKSESLLIRHPADDYAPVWAPDGKAVLFASNRSGSVGLWSVPVTDGRPAGPAELLKGDMGQIMPLGCSRDGVLYYAEHRGMDDIYEAELDPENGKVRGAAVRLVEQFVGRNSAPVWSPDGKSLAYFSNRDPGRAYGVGTREIVVRSMETGAERIFAGSRLSLRQAVRWTPDGRSILIAAKEADTRQRAVFNLLNVATGQMRTIARSNLTLPFPVVDPAGAKFLVAGGDQSSNIGTITQYDLANGEARELYHAPPGWVLRNLAISGDGVQLAFSVANAELRRNVIYTLATAGGEPKEVARLEKALAREGLAWTTDNRYLLFVTGDELFRVPSEGGAPQSTGVSEKGLSLISPHPDGSHIAYTVGQYFRIDIWTLENFGKK
jgi:Tol biopolymer transport system component